jgi:hypothetical protein
MATVFFATNCRQMGPLSFGAVTASHSSGARHNPAQALAGSTSGSVSTEAH